MNLKSLTYHRDICNKLIEYIFWKVVPVETSTLSSDHLSLYKTLHKTLKVLNDEIVARNGTPYYCHAVIDKSSMTVSNDDKAHDLQLYRFPIRPLQEIDF